MFMYVCMYARMCVCKYAMHARALSVYIVGSQILTQICMHIYAHAYITGKKTERQTDKRIPTR
jgi:hypothetical protein